MCALSHLSLVRLFVTVWAVSARLYPWGFSRQEYWSGLPCLLPGDLPDSEIKPTSLTSPALAGRFFITSATWEACTIVLDDHKDSPEFKEIYPWFRLFRTRLYVLFLVNFIFSNAPSVNRYEYPKAGTRVRLWSTPTQYLRRHSLLGSGKCRVSTWVLRGLS